MRDNLNSKGFGIMDANGNHVKAGAGFAYKGYIITMTAIYPNPQVSVFRDGEYPELVSSHDSVQLAIDHVRTLR